ncbi:MAG: hypothetical protein JXA89_00325 [Anaerolineae bacterium]|nr:hypothetical protein [Anaerolineae bacterium]
MDDIREQVKEMWQVLTKDRKQFEAFPADDPQGDALRARHRAALDALVAAEALSVPVSDRLQAAFDQSVLHICSSQSMCYLIYPLEAFPRGDLLARAKALGELETGLDADAVAQARAALERDIAFSQGESEDQQLVALWYSGAIPVDQEARAAAQFLDELLSEEQV